MTATKELYKTWPDERLKKAIEYLKEKNQIWQQRFKKPLESYLTMIKAFQAELDLRKKNKV